MKVCCIVKPTSYYQRFKIISAIKKTQLKILETKDFIYNTEVINVLYDHMSDEARAFIVNKYESKIGLSLLISVSNLNKLKDIIGSDSDPLKCDKDSIRYLFGSRELPEVIGEWKWWENAIHRPIDERERMRDLQLAFP